MDTILSRVPTTVDGIEMVRSLVQLQVEFACAGNPGEGIRLSSEAKTGLANVLMLAEEALGLAIDEIEARDKQIEEFHAEKPRGRLKHLQSV